MNAIRNRVFRGVVMVVAALWLVAAQAVAQPASAAAQTDDRSVTVERNGVSVTVNPGTSVDIRTGGTTTGGVQVMVYRVDGGKWRYYANTGQRAPI